MAAIKVANNYYFCNTDEDRDLLWDEGTFCFVEGVDGELGKYYKLVSGVFVFQYNQNDQPSEPDIASKTPTNKIIVSATEPTGDIELNTIWIPIP